MSIIILTLEVIIYQSLRLGFLLTHKIKIVNRPIPNNSLWNNDDYIYVSRPSYKNHIGHFAEAVNPLIFALRFPEKYPLMTDYFVTNFDPKTEYEWDNTFLSLLLSLFPENYKPRVHFANSVCKQNYICYKHAVTLTVLFDLGIIRCFRL